MTTRKKNLVAHSAKIHPLFLQYLGKDVKRKHYHSINHGINAMLYAAYISRMSKKHREAVSEILFGRTVVKKSPAKKK